MNTQEVFKIVQTYSSGRMYSCVVTAYTSLRIEYIKDKWIEPKAGEIFAFSTESGARSWLMKFVSRHSREIWRADADISNKTLKMIPQIVYLDRMDIEEFWNREQNELPSYIMRNAWPVPEDTVLCKSIILKERIF